MGLVAYAQTYLRTVILVIPAAASEEEAEAEEVALAEAEALAEVALV